MLSPGGSRGGPGAPARGGQGIGQTTLGFPPGSWEGDVRLVRMGHLAKQIWPDSAGMPHGANLSLTGKIQVPDPDVLGFRIRSTRVVPRGLRFRPVARRERKSR